MCHQDSVQIACVPECRPVNTEPVHSLLEAFVEFDGLLPTQSFQLAQVQEIAHVVEWPIAHILDHLIRFHIGLHEFDDVLHNFDDRVLFSCANVVRAACDTFVEHNVEGSSNILNVQVGTLARPITMNGKLLVPLQHHNHLWDQLLRILAGAIDVVSTCHQHRQAVGPMIGLHHHLSRSFGSSVRICWIQGRCRFHLHVILVTVRGIFAVDLICANMDVAQHLALVLLQNLQDSVGAQHVVIRKGHRVPKGQIHVGLRRKVHHGVNFLLLDHVVQKVRAFDVTLHELEVWLPRHRIKVLRVGAVVQTVQNHNLVLGVLEEQMLCHMAGNETCAACDKDVLWLVDGSHWFNASHRKRRDFLSYLVLLLNA
mmetsp:Transcript_18361/g.31141  ORF Transcript_18361/g.31141 Transcript_18361/m.31141 type:complete len:369 (-) Transcript_18361:7-1113(-)